MVESMLEWGALFVLFFFFLSRRSICLKSEWGKYFILIVLFLVIGAIVYTITGKRSSVIQLLVLPLIWRHYLIKQIESYYMIIYSGLIIAVVALLLMVRIIVPLVVQDIDIGNSVGESIGEITKFYVDSPELSAFDMVVASFLQRESLLTAMGGAFRAFIKYNIETVLLTFVPPVFGQTNLFTKIQDICFSKFCREVKMILVLLLQYGEHPSYSFMYLVLC